MNKEELKHIWQRFTEKNNFILNPDAKLVDMLTDGVLKNEQEYGLKLCPCRIRDGTHERDLELLCPCNFKAQEVWKEKQRCWCGLFVKKK